MLIRIYMLSASTTAEKDLLLHAGTGMQKYLDSIHGVPVQGVVKLGRWDVTQPQVIFDYSESYTPCDVAVIFGSWKPREKGHHLVRNSIAYNAPKFICIETALLGRKTSSPNTHYRIGINGFLSRDADWPAYDSLLGHSRLKQLSISWGGWKHNAKGHVLLALQLPGDASLRGIDISQWAAEAIKDIRSVSKRHIVIRSHPLVSDRGFVAYSSLLSAMAVDNVSSLTFSDGATRTWAQDIESAYCTVTYTSGLAIDSVIAGIPTVACDPGNFAFPFSSNFVREIEHIKLADPATIDNWLSQLAMYQYTREEMQEASTWKKYFDSMPLKK